MNYETIKLVLDLENRRGKANLMRLQKELERLGNPHTKIPCIHVAGTNGKGSTTNNMRSILQEAGYQVGTFTSPSMQHHFDRIRVNDVPIDEISFLFFMKDYKRWKQLDMTMFEIDFLIATQYFMKQQVDFIIYEVGLGGKLDTTNVITPLVSIITNIGKDHMELLGNTLEEIAYAKAGIIKQRVPVITAEKKKECLAVFKKVCKEKNTYVIGIEEIKDCKNEETGVSFTYQNKQYLLNSHACYQCENAACAIEAIHELIKQGYLIKEQDIDYGLQKAFWIGRFEIMRSNPFFVIDGAHNAHGMNALVSSMPRYPNLRVICSALQDKELEEMIALLKRISQDIVVVHFDSTRAIDEKRVHAISNVTWGGEYQPLIQEAWKDTKPILVTGSLYFIAEVRKYLMELKKSA